MPNEPYVYETVLDMCSVDFTGHWQPGAIFRAMQEAGDGHCHVLDLTFERLRGLHGDTVCFAVEGLWRDHA